MKVAAFFYMKTIWSSISKRSLNSASRPKANWTLHENDLEFNSQTQFKQSLKTQSELDFSIVFHDR